MDDAHVAAVDLRRVHHLQEPHRPADSVHRQVVVAAGLAANQGVPGSDLTFCVLHVCAAVQHFSGDGVQGPASLGA